MPDSTPRYIPQTVGDVLDHVSMMMLSSPQFRDTTGYSPDQDLGMVFRELELGLLAIGGELGEDRFRHLTRLAARMRRHFEADPEDKTDEAIKGRECVLEMENILRDVARRER